MFEGPDQMRILAFPSLLVSCRPLEAARIPDDAVRRWDAQRGRCVDAKES